jgi:serine/threonine protein kinase
MKGIVGLGGWTGGFVSPDVRSRRLFNKASDIYALGITMLRLHYPQEVWQRMFHPLRSDLEYPFVLPPHKNANMISLLTSMLSFDHRDRPSATEALLSPYFDRLPRLSLHNVAFSPLYWTSLAQIDSSSIHTFIQVDVTETMKPVVEKLMKTTTNGNSDVYVVTRVIRIESARLWHEFFNHRSALEESMIRSGLIKKIVRLGNVASSDWSILPHGHHDVNENVNEVFLFSSPTTRITVENVKREGFRISDADGGTSAFTEFIPTIKSAKESDVHHVFLTRVLVGSDADIAHEPPRRVFRIKTRQSCYPQYSIEFTIKKI